MGLLSSSKSAVSNIYDTDTTTTQVDNSGNSGFQNIGGGVSLESNTDNSIYNTSQDNNSRSFSSNYSSQDDNSLSLSSSQSTSNSNNTSTTNYLSDSGAVRAASDIAGGAFGVAGAGLDNARAAAAGALNFGSTAISQLAEANSDSLSVLKGLISGAFDNSVTLARDSIAANRAATDSAITGFGSLAQQTSASDGDRISKVAIYAFAALAAAFVLPALFRGKAVSL